METKLKYTKKQVASIETKYTITMDINSVYAEFGNTEEINTILVKKFNWVVFELKNPTNKQILIASKGCLGEEGRIKLLSIINCPVTLKKVTNRFKKQAKQLEEFKTVMNIDNQRLASLKDDIKEVASELNLTSSFSGFSNKNGFSAYFLINNKKVRFSDHSIISPERIKTEICIYDYSCRQEILNNLNGVFKK